MKNIYYITKQKVLFEDDQFTTVDSSKELINYLEVVDEFGVDTETTSLDFNTARVLLMSIGDENVQFVIDCTTARDVVYEIKYYLTNKKHRKIIQNSMFDYKVIRSDFGIVLEHVFDTMLCEKIIYNGLLRGTVVNLPTLVGNYLNLSMTKDVRSNFTKKAKEGVVIFDRSEIIYSAYDVEVLPAIKNMQLNGKKNSKGILLSPGLKTYNLENVANLEFECALAFADIEYNGIYLNKEYYSNEVIPFYKSERKYIIDTLDTIVIDLCDMFGIKGYKPESYALSLFGGKPLKHPKSTKAGRISKKQSEKADDSTGLVGINWNSPEQVKNFLSKEIGLDCYYRDTKTGQETTSVKDEVLYRYCVQSVRDFLEQKKYDEARAETTLFFERVKNETDVVVRREGILISLVNYILLFRSVNVIITRYGENLFEMISSATGRIHPSFHPLGPDTGRASCSKPNLQNIPAKQIFRTGFSVQHKGCSMMTIDYSGAELRLIAEASNEQVMIKAFNSGEDVHAMMGTIAFNIPVSKEQNSEKRSQIKNVNFGLAYGATAESDKIVKAFGSVEESKKFLDTYFKTFPNLKSYFESSRLFAERNGYSLTFEPYNRIRWYEGHSDYVKEINEKGPGIKKALFKVRQIGREGMNQPIQGTSADIMKLAMCYIRRYLIDNYLHDTLLLVNQVHDELVIEETIPGLLNDHCVKISELMVLAGELVVKKLKMEVDYTIASHWKK